MTGLSAILPFRATSSEPVLVGRVAPDAPVWLKLGQKITFDQFYSRHLGDRIKRVIKSTSKFQPGDDVDVSIGIEHAQKNEAFVRSVFLSTVQETVIFNGRRFQTRPEGGE